MFESEIEETESNKMTMTKSKQNTANKVKPDLGSLHQTQLPILLIGEYYYFYQKEFLRTHNKRVNRIIFMLSNKIL